jgi:curved DNA-binding protein CbpA
MKDFYYILGISQTASVDEIKTAYRKLSLKFHPDKNNGDDFFAERFKDIQEAYETLINTTKRRVYDERRNNHSSSSSGLNFTPHIEYFKANKASFEFDEEITFSWKTINANKVTINPFGEVQPIGQKTYKIRDFKNPNFNCEIIAVNLNINQQVRKNLTLINRTYQELYQHFKSKVNTEKVEAQSKTYYQQQTETNKTSKQTQKELDDEADKAASTIFIIIAIALLIVFSIIFLSSK